MKLDIKYLNTVCNDPWLKLKKSRTKILKNVPDRFNKYIYIAKSIIQYRLIFDTKNLRKIISEYLSEAIRFKY